jgi:hypothetical protein
MKFQAAAMSRADIPEDQRVDFSLYVDEFQNFSTDSFATILSEARKYRLNLIVANQFIGQLTEEIRDAVFGNVGTIITLRAGATDADFLVKQFSPIFDTQDIIKVPNHNAIVRLMIGGIPSQPFSMSTLPPFGQPNEQLAIALKQLSASKYGRPRATVEKDIFKRLETKAPPPRRPGAMGAGTRMGSAPATNARPLASGQPPALGAKKPGSNSFLDEWLAKKRREAKQAPTASTSQTSPTSSPPLATTAPPAVQQPVSSTLVTQAQPENQIQQADQVIKNHGQPIQYQSPTTPSPLNPPASGPVLGEHTVMPVSQPILSAASQAPSQAQTNSTTPTQPPLITNNASVNTPSVVQPTPATTEPIKPSSPPMPSLANGAGGSVSFPSMQSENDQKLDQHEEDLLANIQAITNKVKLSDAPTSILPDEEPIDPVSKIVIDKDGLIHPDQPAAADKTP